MSRYTSIVPRYPVDVDDEQTKKEMIQKRHYYLFNELQNLARELPPKYQQRLPYDLLSALSSSLLDGTVYEIVHGLKEIQHMTEKNLLSARNKLISEQKAEAQEMLKKHKESIQDCQNKTHNTQLVQSANEKERENIEKKHAESLTRADMKLILELDQKVSDQQVTLEKAGVPGFFVTNNPNEIRVSDQQVTLEKAGVPGFFVTNNPNEIRLQMYLLEFIQRLRNMERPE